LPNHTSAGRTRGVAIDHTRAAIPRRSANDFVRELAAKGIGARQSLDTLLAATEIATDAAKQCGGSDAIVNDWLATMNWRFAYVRDPQTFAWPGSWDRARRRATITERLAALLMFGDPSDPLHDPLGSGRGLEVMHGPSPRPSTDADGERTSPSPIALRRKSGRSWH